MKFSQADTSGGLLIRGYGAEGVVVNDRVYASSLIVTPQRVIADWRPRSASDLRAEDCSLLVQIEPQILILGTGDRQVFPEPANYWPILERGIGIEIMDTGAACRTYNIIMAEGREVAAALILP
jgi:uncharacterized protein